VQRALFLPPFGELSDPRVLCDLALAAEGSGWDGFFLWDHMKRPPDDPAEVADAWVCLSAVATVTTRLRLGPMITPLARRRPQKVAREATTLDHLSRGRLVLGLGLGVDTDGELARFGEEADPHRRAELFDEGVAVLDALFTGEVVDHHGPHYTVDGVRFLPRPVQRPRVPLWFAARPGSVPPLLRAARYDGVFPIEPGPDELARMLEVVATHRGDLQGFEVAVLDHDGVELDALAGRGATWGMRWVLPGATAADVERLALAGPR
jgi:alkanesulfonate monooxygenase SsuD/methylene tetrahydromethanopterin reductase-like flavin-dependent oxidoreductase (luciferase family)